MNGREVRRCPLPPHSGMDTHAGRFSPSVPGDRRSLTEHLLRRRWVTPHATRMLDDTSYCRRFAVKDNVSRQTYPFNLPDLPYAYNALEPHIDANTLRIHHRGHHNT